MIYIQTCMNQTFQSLYDFDYGSVENIFEPFGYIVYISIQLLLQSTCIKF